jgi:hypothetical protein
MSKKKQPVGICDHCLGEIPRRRWYTSKGEPRLYCSRGCRNTANSRAGSAIRSEKAKQRVERSEWQNPAKLNPPDPAKVATGVSRARKREVEEGRWRNPALPDEARAKLSRPRKHSGALHRALEKLRQGYRVADLKPEEQKVHRAYRKQLRDARRDEINAYRRRRYREQQARMTEEDREAQRAKWREQNRKRKNKN